MIKRIVFLFTVLFFTFTGFTTITNAYEITIVAEESKVGNIYWEIKDENKNTIPDGTEVDLIDSNGNIIKGTVVKDGYVFFKDIPFGNYTVMVNKDKTKTIPVTIDKSSLSEQHLKQVKILEKVSTESNTTKTGDVSDIYPIVITLLVSGLFLVYYKLSYRKEV